MLLENSVLVFVAIILYALELLQVCPVSIITAVQTSPKIKWLSLSLKFKCALQISGITIITRFAISLLIVEYAVCIAKVAEEQATFISKANPLIPNSF